MGLEELQPGALQELADCGKQVDEWQGERIVAQVLQVCTDTSYDVGAAVVFMILSDTGACLKVTLGGAALGSYHNDELCIGKLVEVTAVAYDSFMNCPRVTGISIRNDLGRHPTIGSPKVIFSAPSAPDTRSTTATTTPTEAPLSFDSSVSFGKWGSLQTTEFPTLHSTPNTPAVSPRRTSGERPAEAIAIEAVSSACSSLVTSVNIVTDTLPSSLPPSLVPTLTHLSCDISKLTAALDALSQKLGTCLSAPRGYEPQTPTLPLSPLTTNLAAGATKRARVSTGARSRAPAAGKVPDEKVPRSRSTGVHRVEKKKDVVAQDVSGQGGPLIAPLKQPPWIRCKLYAPAEVANKKCDRQLKLSLRHVFGYKGAVRGTETVVSGNLAVTKKDVVYSVSSIVVLQALEDGSQRFFSHHNDDVTCLAQHPSRRHVFATSSLSLSKPQLVIWDANDVRKPYRTISCSAGKGVLLMCFSKGGLLATISSDSQNTLTIWDWLKEQVLCTAPTGKDSNGQIKGMSFSPFEDRTLITYGTNHLRRWCVSTTLTGKLAVYGKKGETQSILCHQYFVDMLLVGTHEGNLLMFAAGIDGILKLVHTTKDAHKGPVLSMCGLHNEQTATGGRDNTVKFWVRSEGGMVMVKSIPLLRDVVPVSLDMSLAEGDEGSEVCGVGGVASLVVGPDSALYLGTTTNKLLVLNSDAVPSVKMLQNSHNKVGEFRALATHPLDSFFVTGADDKVLKVWRHDTQQLVKEVNVRGRVRALCYSPDGARVAVGYSSGCWEVFCSSLTEESVFSTFQQKVEPDEEEVDPLEVVEEPVEKKPQHVETGEVTVLEYSPDCELLAIGFKSSCVDVFKVSAGYAKVGTCKAHHGAVRSIDWSNDASVLQVATTSHEVLHFTSGGVHLVHPHLFRDIMYSTWSSPLGWCTLGLWDGNTCNNASEVTSLTASHAKSTLIASDIHGRLLCTAFPLTTPSKSKRVFRGHSPLISKVCTAANDTLLSIGNTDRCIFLWAIA
eukprot:TRINITY_DN8155_c0_g2_i1.p1 TRINITY_DN8155_c0_g2~~TRINITY_DN8155_c0_g2_i1.p1  ORF type:complete len:1006 (+),score=295.38 TRINITY_DN8155_c0_g2_i1:34-3051(+)